MQAIVLNVLTHSTGVNAKVHGQNGEAVVQGQEDGDMEIVHQI